MDAPAQLTIPTCFGCGAMGIEGTCARGCREQKLELVRAAAVETMTAIETAARERIAALRPLAEELASGHPGDEEVEEAYRSLQQRARAALREHPGPPAGADELGAPAAAATTWWCPQCGGLDAPQDCLGICIWRPVAWARADVYAGRRAAAADRREQALALQGLLRQLAFTSPRPGGWAATWAALQARAQDLLAPDPAPR